MKFLHNYETHSCGFSTQELRSEEEIHEAFQSYRQCAIIARNFNNVFSSNIEHIKTIFTLFSVACNYILLRNHATLPINLIMPLIDWITFCHSLPPLLYNNAYKLNENTIEAKRRLAESVMKARMPDDRRYCRMLASSLRPINIRVMGIYFLDRRTTPLYLRIILDNTVALLVSY